MDLINWPPERGPVNPHLPRITHNPRIRRIKTFQKLPIQPSIKSSEESEGIEGNWLCNYRVSAVRSLNFLQSQLIKIEDLSLDRYDWFFRIRDDDDDEDDDEGPALTKRGRRRRNKKMSLPTLYVDFKSILIEGRQLPLDAPYRLAFTGCEIVYKYKKARGREKREDWSQDVISHNIFLLLVSKELERIYKRLGYADDFQHLYFRDLDVNSTGLVKIGYNWHRSPKTIASASSDIKVKDLRDYEKVSSNRANQGKVQGCGLIGEWRCMYSINVIASLTLQQAHELLHLSKLKSINVVQGHPEFEERRERERSHQERVFILDQRKDEEEDDDEWDDDEDEGLESSWKQRLFCNKCHSENLSYEDYEPEPDPEFDDEEEEDLGLAICDDCDHRWTEPAIEDYSYSKKISLFNNWAKCRGERAPTVTADISSYINQIVRVTIPPASFNTDLGPFLHGT